MSSSKKFLVDIDLNANSLNNATIGANASMTKAGSFQYDAGANRLQYYNGSIVETVANLNDITGGLNFQGGYNAATNTPNLTTPTAGTIFKGYYYVVTVAGTFFGEQLNIGDSLFANVDDPASLIDWTLVQGNLDLASESVAGIVYLASSAQVATGTETGAYAVNPATLQGKIDAQSFSESIGTGDWTLDVDHYSKLVTHNLNQEYVNVNAWTGGIPVDVAYEYNTVNSTYVYVNELPAAALVATFSRVTPY